MQQLLITFEIVAGVAAFLALVWTIYTALADWKQAQQSLTNYGQVKAAIEEADASAIELKKKGELLRIKGLDAEATKVFDERLEYFKTARALEASLEQPREDILARDVLLTRRVVTRGLLAAGLTVVSIASGTFAGAAGAAQTNPTDGSPTPSP